jgi:hypothetical protein
LGQHIFDSTDPKKGWDGRIGGKDQESGGYVWICSYRFDGEEEKKGKGNFVLIR